MDWALLQRQWPASWTAALKGTVERHGDRIRTHPDAYRDRVREWMSVLNGARQVLEESRALLVRLPHAARPEHQARHNALVHEARSLAAGVYGHADDAPTVAGAPLLVVGGLGLGVVAIAWAVASFTHAAGFLVRARTERDELRARIAAAARGQTLPPSTLPAPSPTPQVPWVGLALGGLALAAGAVALPAFLTSEAA